MNDYQKLDLMCSSRGSQPEWRTNTFTPQNSYGTSPALTPGLTPRYVVGEDGGTELRWPMGEPPRKLHMPDEVIESATDLTPTQTLTLTLRLP